MKKQKNLATMFATVFLFVTILSCTAFAANSYYTSTLSFKTPFDGKARTFNQNNIQYSATTYTVGQKAYMPTTYRVTLCRKNFLSYDVIGYRDLSRDGYGTSTWTNVGPGNYYFSFSKAQDGATVKSSKVIMRSYN